MSEKRNIFITGMAGFLGSHLHDRFHTDGHYVFGNDNLIGGDWSNIKTRKVEIMALGKPEDCRDPRGMWRYIRSAESKILFHCAATAYEGLSVFSPSFVTRNIYEASVATFTAAIAAGVKRIIFLSSMARYGTQAWPFREDQPPMPQDPYGIAKVAAEQTLKCLCETHGVEYVIAVPHNIYGPRQKYDDPYRNVASIFANRMLRGEQPVIYGDGNQRRCFSYIGDVLDCLVRLMEVPSGTVINVGPDEQFVTINHLAREIADIIGFDLDPVYVPGRPLEVKHATCSSDLAREMLGYETKTSLREGLGHLIEDIRQRGPKPFDYRLPLEIERGAPETWRRKLI